MLLKRDIEASTVTVNVVESSSDIEGSRADGPFPDHFTPAWIQPLFCDPEETFILLPAVGVVVLDSCLFSVFTAPAGTSKENQ